MYFKSDNDFTAGVVILHRKKTLIEITGSEQEIHSMDEIAEMVKPFGSAALIIDGRGIIHKKTEKKNTSPLKLVLPNAREEDFYVQSCGADPDHFFVSVVRKQFVTALLNEFARKNIIIHHLWMGPFVLNNALPLFSSNECASFPYYELSIKDNRISGIDQKRGNGSNNYLNMGDEEIPDILLPAYSAALADLTSDISGCDLSVDAISANKKERLFKHLFKYTLWFILAFFFIVLLINFLVYDNLNKKNSAVNFRIRKNEEIIKKLESLREEILQKEELVSSSGLQNKVWLSRISDRIGYTLPNEIVLTLLDLNPITGKIKPDEEIIVQNNWILLRGKTRYSTVLNSWIGQLEKEDWVAKVNIRSFNQEDLRAFGEFELEIIMD